MGVLIITLKYVWSLPLIKIYLQVTAKHYSLLSLQNSFRVTHPSVNDVVDQCKSLYKKKSSPVKVTLLCSKQTGFLFTGTLATHLARFSQIEVTVVVREGDSFYHRWLKEDSEMFGYRLLEAKKQSDFDDPLDCLLFPPLAFKTDM